MGELIPVEFSKRLRFRHALDDPYLREFWRQRLDSESFCPDVDFAEKVEAYDEELLIQELSSEYHLNLMDAQLAFEGARAEIGLRVAQKAHN